MKLEDLADPLGQAELWGPSGQRATEWKVMDIKSVGWKPPVLKVWRLVATGEACRWVTVG